MSNWKCKIMDSNIRTYKKIYFDNFGELPKNAFHFLAWLKANRYIICSEGFDDNEYAHAKQLINDDSNLHL